MVMPRAGTVSTSKLGQLRGYPNLWISLVPGVSARSSGILICGDGGESVGERRWPDPRFNWRPGTLGACLAAWPVETRCQHKASTLQLAAQRFPLAFLVRGGCRTGSVGWKNRGRRHRRRERRTRERFACLICDAHARSGPSGGPCQ